MSYCGRINSWNVACLEFHFSRTDCLSIFTSVRGSQPSSKCGFCWLFGLFFSRMEKLLTSVFWFFIRRRQACQLYLALLHLRRAGQHFVIAWHIDYTADCINENVLWYGTQSEHILKPRRKGAAAVHFLEGACLLWESLSLFLAVVSTVCVAVRHVLQAALFLIISTVRWPQKMLLSKEDLDEWEKEQKKERKELQEQRQQVEKYLTVVEHFPSLHKTKRS